MLNFSSQTQRLRSTFMAYRNDIDIYTEDEAKDKQFYVALINKLVDPAIKIKDVTPLGSKDEVIRRCVGEIPNGRKKLFIVDGDINLINDKVSYTYPNLYVHDAYCIENLLIDEDTVTKFIYIQCAVKSIDEISSELDYNNWLSIYCDSLIELFLHFAVIDKLGKPFTLGNAYRYHRSSVNTVFNKQDVESEVDKVKAEILGVISQNEYDREIDALRKKWVNDIDTLTKIISGKDYLIPILILKTSMFKKSKAVPSLQEIKMLLVTFSKLDRFLPLKVAIESL